MARRKGLVFRPAIAPFLAAKLEKAMPHEPEKITQETADELNAWLRANTPPIPKGFYAWLDAIRENPALYLGKKSFLDLMPWIIGYTCGRDDAGLEMSDEEREFRGFNRFIDKKVSNV